VSHFTPADTSFDESSCGAQDIPHSVKTPLDVYQLIIDQTLVEHLVEKSNEYAIEKKVDNTSGSQFVNSIFQCKYRVNKDQIWRYLAVVFAMGLAPLPSLKLYWQENGLYGNDFIKRTLSRTEFYRVNRIIHCDIDATVNLLNQRYQK
jgi:hypothetical protein